MKKRIAIGIVGSLIVSVIGFKACCTFVKRDPAFEARIDMFVRDGNPGSEMDLFNGRDLGGWAAYGFGSWRVDGGAVTFRRGTGYLATRCEEFMDFVLDADIRVNKNGNSGIFFRARHPGFGLRSQPVGYEAQVDHHDPKNPTGSLYNRVTAYRIVSRDGEWFHMRVSAIGERIQIQVNGETVVDATNADCQKGFIALQGHDPFSVVSYKNIRVRIPPNE